MPALLTGRAGIHMQAGNLLVVHHLQDMGMAGDKKLRPVARQQLFGLWRITAGIAADVEDKDGDALRLEDRRLRKEAADGRVVDVSPDAPERFEILQRAYDFGRAEIPRMPDLVDVFEMVKNGGVEVAVGVGEEADSGQSEN